MEQATNTQTTEEPDQKYVRQRDIIPETILETPITLIGAGAVGGTTAFFLSKTGFCNLRVYDDDKVEIYNLPNSIYRMLDIGKPKVKALKEIIQEFDGLEIMAMNKKWDKQLIEGIFICSVDSMETRHNIWRTIKRLRVKVPLYIDARMGAEVMRIYAIDPIKEDEVKLYEKTLCPPENVEIAPCTAKATMYCASVIGGIIVSLLKRRLLEQERGVVENKKPTAREIIYDISGDDFLIR